MSGIADEQALALEQTGGSMPDGVQEEYEFGRGRPACVVENGRNPDDRVVQRQVLYLGEINDSRRAAR